MTAVLPVPVDLPGPPRSPELLWAALEQLAGAAFAAGTVTHLLEPVAVLHGCPVPGSPGGSPEW
nr:hypothetical protein [uncultured Friedmanniella sp.]